MEQAARENRERYRAHVLTREFQIFGKNKEKATSEVWAETSFVPPTTKEFRILSRSGSSRGEGIVRRFLEDEVKAAAGGDAPGAITRENYDFTLLGESAVDGNSCHVLALKAKREDKRLINGRVWVDERTYLVRRMEGQMAKLPSWWLRSVYVTVVFAPVAGMWMQTGTTAVADVRLIGRHVFTSRAVSLRVSQTEAKNFRNGGVLRPSAQRPWRGLGPAMSIEPLH